MPTQLEMQSMAAQIDQAKSLQRIAAALEQIAEAIKEESE